MPVEIAPSPTTQSDNASPIGKSFSRRDGRDKVSGQATFSAEWDLPGCVYAVGLTSAIARGMIAQMDTSAAQKASGFKVLTHETCPKMDPATPMSGGGKGSAGTSVMPFAGKEIFHDGQWIGATFGKTLEIATHAASLVKVKYQRQTPETDFTASIPAAEEPKKVMGEPATITKGDPDAAYLSAAVKLDLTYTTPKENHNPIEPHATIAAWGRNEDGEPTLQVYDASQYIFGCRAALAEAFGLKEDNVRVVCKYIGGAFGCKGAAWPHVFIAAVAAKFLGKPVRFVLEREQMYGGIGFRPATRQRVRLGASPDGKLAVQMHEGTSAANRKDNYVEAFTVATRHMYASPALKLAQKIVRLDTQSPTFMRAPGETPGMFATESAMDEMAAALKLDPIQFRKINEPAVDPHNGLPFSNRKLIECMETAADKFGWKNRKPAPAGITDATGRWKIGMGMAAATYHASFLPNAAKIVLRADGTALVRCGTQEMGTGTATAQAAVAAEALGLAFERVKFELGDTRYPKGSVSGGSMTTAGVGGAVYAAAYMLKKKLVAMAVADGFEPFKQAKIDDITFAGGKLVLKADPAKGLRLEQVLSDAAADELEVEGNFADAHPPGVPGKFSAHSFGAHFCEVGVDAMLGLVRVRRFASCFAAGRILNAKTARSQFLGGIVMGIGQALLEETFTDDRYGKITNHNLSEYHVPTNADVGPIQIMWLPEPDYNASPIGAKGIGEIGITGVAAAIANAVYNATGKRLRDLPLTAERVMA